MPIFRIRLNQPQEPERFFEVKTTSGVEYACLLVCKKHSVKNENLTIEEVIVRVGALLLGPMMGDRTIGFSRVSVSSDEFDTGLAYAKATDDFEKAGFEVLGTFDESDSAMGNFPDFELNDQVEEIRVKC